MAKQSRTQSNACLRVRVGIGSGETEFMRKISYAAPKL